MNQRICFNWHMIYQCNYRCPYCFYYSSWHNQPKLKMDLTVERWLEAWHRMYEKYGSIDVEMTGGEPFVYPAFDKLVIKMSKEHYISITTNLSYDLERLTDFINQIEHGRLNMVLSFHPLFSEFELFLKKALLLKKKGISVIINFVAYPPQFNKMVYFKDKFEKEGLCFVPVPFRGEFQGKGYPEGYSEEEKKVLNKFSDNLNSTDSNYKKFQKQWIESQIVHKKSKGKLCRAGHVYAHVNIYGKVYRCNTSIINNNHPIGDFFDENFELLNKPLPCEIEACHCESKWLLEEGEVFNKNEIEIIIKKANNKEMLPRVKCRRFGKTELMISEVGLGGHTYNTKGGIAKLSLAGGTEIISTALDLGFNYFDACDGDELRSNIMILNKLNARDKCIIAYGDNVEGDRIINADEGFIREHVERHLKTLQADRIDVLRVLDWSIADYARKINVPVEREIEDIVFIINKLKKEGKVRFACFSTHLQDDLEILAGKAEIGKLFDILQIRFNFFETGPAKRIIPYAKAHDMGIVVIKPFRKGTLLNKFCGDSSDPTYADLKLPQDELFENLPYKEKGLAFALLKFILLNKDISVVIPGVASVEQVLENASASIIE